MEEAGSMSSPETEPFVPLLLGVTAASAAGAADAHAWAATELDPALAALGVPVAEVLDCSLGAFEGGAATPSRFDTVVTTIGPYGAVCALLEQAMGAQRIGGWAAFGGVESRRFDRVCPATSAATSVKRISLHRRIPSVSVAEYRRIFTSHFVITRDNMAPAWRYRQTDVERRDGPLGFPVDGISEFWFADEAALADPYGGDAEAKSAVQTDSRLFVDSGTAVTVNGYEHTRRAPH
jgi:hypothetical protein